MKKRFASASLLGLALSACNLYGGLDKPHNDEQYLVAARACLDSGDYECAKSNYQALSSNQNDVKVSEHSLTVLAENRIFSISDLVGSLGDDLGSAKSYTFLAQTLAARNILSGSYRTTIKGVYDNDSAIINTDLKAFSKFLASVAMFNQVLANAIGADGQLTASDIVDAAKLSTCKSESTVACAADVANTTCTPPAGTALIYNASDNSSMSATTAPNNNWSGPASIQKLISSAVEASQQAQIFSNSGSADDGILGIVDQISHISGTEACARKLLIQYLSL